MRLTGSWEYDTEGRKQNKLKMVREGKPNSHDLQKIADVLRMDIIELKRTVVAHGGCVLVRPTVNRQYIEHAVFYDPSQLGVLLKYLEPWELAARMAGD